MVFRRQLVFSVDHISEREKKTLRTGAVQHGVIDEPKLLPVALFWDLFITRVRTNVVTVG